MKKGEKKKNLELWEEELSEERTLLSNERTLLSYIRTSFAIVVAGIAIIGFFKNGFVNFLGFVVLFVGIFVLVLGVIYYFIRKRDIEKERQSSKIFSFLATFMTFVFPIFSSNPAAS